MGIKENLEIIKNNISLYEHNSGRKAGCVSLMAVSKFHPAEAVLSAIKENQFLFGENRVQEAKEKFSPIRSSNPKVQLHIIGSLQLNKVRNAVQIAACIQSVDRLELLEEIEKQCARIGKSIKILYEVHTGEDSKAGFTSEMELRNCIEASLENKFPHIIPSGFMTMAPFTDDEKLIHNSFITLRELSQKLQNEYKALKLTELSMGMSGDYKIAIEEGSTLVRVGTAIFGERDYSKK